MPDHTVYPCNVIKRIYFGADTYEVIREKLVPQKVAATQVEDNADGKGKKGKTKQPSIKLPPKLIKYRETLTLMGGQVMTYRFPGSARKLMLDRRKRVVLVPDDYTDPDKREGWLHYRQEFGKIIASPIEREAPTIGEEYFGLMEKHWLAELIKAYGENPIIKMLLVLIIIGALVFVGYFAYKQLNKIPAPGTTGSNVTISQQAGR